MSNSKELNILMQKDNQVSIFSEFATAGVLSTFNFLIKGSLFEVKEGYELGPGLIKSWKWDSQNNSYVLTLDEKVRFHDKSKPTIEDLEFTLLRGFFSTKRTFYDIYLGSILGVDEIKEGQTYKPWSVKGITKVDEDSLRIKLKYPNPSILYSLTRPFFSLTSKRFYNNDLLNGEIPNLVES